MSPVEESITSVKLEAPKMKLVGESGAECLVLLGFRLLDYLFQDGERGQEQKRKSRLSFLVP